MVSKNVLNCILDDERLTHGLHDPEARILIEWLVARTEQWADQGMPADSLDDAVGRMCRRARAIVLFVRLWCHQQSHGAAGQLAATERFSWPLPPAFVDPCELMLTILVWEAGCSSAG
jgi:agmatine/peptidylarginine deiminase